MQDRFEQFIHQHGLCTRGQQVFVAVSGGVDSMVLQHLFWSAGFKPTAIHVNFHLRGDESDEDEAFVKKQGQKLGVSVLTKSVLTNNYATEHGVSVQMAARDLRYKWFRELLEQNPGAVLATAHHLNDSEETLLLNLVRGTGIDGLTGVPLENNGIIRPLLFAKRSDIMHYAGQHSIVWREDASNIDDHYQRNFIRHQVISQLKKINPSLEDTMARNFSRLGSDRELLEKSVASWKESFITLVGDRLLIRKDGLSDFIHKAGVLMRVIEQYGFNFQTAESVVAAMEGQPGKIFFSKSHQLVIDREHLIVTAIVEQHESVVIQQGQPVAFMRKSSLQLSTSNDKTIERFPSVANLDLSKVVFPLTWRRWQPGDSFIPLGMKGRKKISDLLTDLKMALDEKNQVTVIESNGEIMWVVGVRVDERYRVSDDTTDVLTIRLV